MTLRHIPAVLACCALLLAACLAAAQRAPGAAARPELVAALSESPSLSRPGYVIHAEVREVRIDLRVKDGQGRPVTELNPADLRVFDSQRRVAKLSSLRQWFDLPLTIAVLIDSSGSTARVLSEEKQAALDFLHAVMRPGDRALVAGFAERLGTVEETSAGLEPLRRNLDQMRTGEMTALFDSMLELCRTRLSADSGSPRRQVLILLSDGADNYSMQNLDDAIEAAMKAEVTVFTVTFRSGRSGFDRVASLNLRYLSATTGGDSLFVNSPGELTEIFERINRELRSYYVLTYPAPAEADGESFHPVRIITANQEWKVQAKAGYFVQD